MMLLLASVAFAGELPELSVQWRTGHGRILVTAPAGEHLAEDAPAEGWVSVDSHRWEFQTTGSALTQGLGVALPGKDLHTLTGEMRLSFCEDEGTACRWAELSFWGLSQGRRGRASLSVMPKEVEVAGPLIEPSPDIDGAFATAAADEKLLLLDFSATWCPPCNLLAAQLLHHPDQAWAMEPFVVLELDADRPASWALKDRYEVGGYPTLVMVRPDGSVVDRLVGYPGLESTLAWLEEVQTMTPLPELAESPETQGADASSAALRLAQAGEPEAARLHLERAEDNADAHLARMWLEASEEEAFWLLENAPETLPEWIWKLSELPSVTPGLKHALLAALPGAILEAEAHEAADFGEWAAAWAEPDQKQVLLALMTRVAESAMTGDPAQDRGLYTSLADLYRRAGHPEMATAILWEAISNYPEEFTWHYALAGHHKQQGELEEALDSAASAVSFSYGDNHLRAVERQAQILNALGRPEEARLLAQETLNTQPPPEEGIEVRTWRYRAALEEYVTQKDLE